MMETIKAFTNKNKFLSNFYPCRIFYRGLVYESAEHAYQASKTYSANDSWRIRHAETPALAKRYGREVAIRSDWEFIKDYIMLEIIRIKFKIPELTQMLLDTDDAELIEGNYWKDTYWGVDTLLGGQNKLGKMLMMIRKEIGGK